jgi:hypothetical protein
VAKGLLARAAGVPRCDDPRLLMGFEALLDFGCRSNWVCVMSVLEGRPGDLALATSGAAPVMNTICVQQQRSKFSRVRTCVSTSMTGTCRILQTFKLLCRPIGQMDGLGIGRNLLPHAFCTCLSCLAIRKLQPCQISFPRCNNK